MVLSAGGKICFYVFEAMPLDKALVMVIITTSEGKLLMQDYPNLRYISPSPGGFTSLMTMYRTRSSPVNRVETNKKSDLSQIATPCTYDLIIISVNDSLDVPEIGSEKSQRGRTHYSFMSS